MTSHEPPVQVPAQGRTTLLLAVIAAILVCAALKAAQIVFLPVVLAAFLAMLVQPPIAFMERYVPKGVALVLVLAVLLAFLVGAWAFVGVSLVAVAERGPAYLDRLVFISDKILRPLERFGLPTSVTEVPITRFAQWGLEVVGASLLPIMAALGVGTLVAFTLVLMLLEVDSFRIKVRKGLRDHDSAEFFATLHSVARSFQTFLFVKTLISLLTGALTAVVVYAMGIDFPFLWGTLTFLLNFIPNIGSMIAVMPPVLLAFLQFDGLARPVGTLAMLTALQMFIGNFLDPRWLGRSLSLSPLVVFVSMVFWGWLWGLAGVFLAVPLTILIKIVFEHVQPLRPLAIAMADYDRRRPDAAPIDDAEIAAALVHTGKYTSEDG